MDDFNTIRLKRKTILKFKEFSRKTGSNYSETLDFMIAFFEDNNLSPFDVLGYNLTSFSNRFDKRINAVIEILRTIENTQLKPTKELLELAFKEADKIEKPLIVEKANFNVNVDK